MKEESINPHNVGFDPTKLAKQSKRIALTVDKSTDELHTAWLDGGGSVCVKAELSDGVTIELSQYGRRIGKEDNRFFITRKKGNIVFEFDQFPTLSAALGKLVEAIDSEAFMKVYADFNRRRESRALLERTCTGRG